MHDIADKEQALIHSDAARQGALEEHRSIKLSTYGILFMGTPHQGGNGVRLGELMLNVASIFMKADDKILKHLERDSEWLQQQLGQYAPISREFITKFAYEIFPTPISLGITIMVSIFWFVLAIHLSNPGGTACFRGRTRRCRCGSDRDTSKSP